MPQPNKTRSGPGHGNGGSRAGGNGARKIPATVRELPRITTRSDTRDILAHAAKDAKKIADYFVVDVDAHVTEVAFWNEITDLIDSDVYRQWAQSFRDRAGGGAGALMNISPGMSQQDVFGRIPHDHMQGENSDHKSKHRQVVLTERAMDAMGIDYQIVFPTPMLQLGMHPQPDVEVVLGKAFNRWMTEQDPAAAAAHEDAGLSTVLRAGRLHGGDQGIRR